MTKKIGIYSGTFDPPHVGHITFAEETLRACNLSKVILLPEAQPRNKPNVSRLSVRTRHIERMIANKPFLDIFHSTTSRFTIKETLPEIQSVFKHDTVTLLVGSDVVKSMHTWPDLGILLKHAHIAIGMRHNESDEAIHAIIRPIEKQYRTAFSYTIIHTQHADMSSTAIRTATITV